MPLPFVVNVSGGFAKNATEFRDSTEKQLRYAARIALNNTAKAAVEDIKARLPSIFDKPTPATLNSMFVRYATPDNLSASIEIKDFTGKGHAPQQWLMAEIDGGDRRQKASEKALISAGVMNPGQFWTPNVAPNPPPGLLDPYGNVPSSTIVQIMSRLGAFGEQGYKANMTERSRRRLLRKGMLVARGQRSMSDYFVYRRDGVPRAIMQLVAKGDARAVLWLTNDQPRYSPRFKFDDLVLAFVEKHFKPEMARCLEHALATAK